MPMEQEAGSGAASNRSDGDEHSLLKGFIGGLVERSATRESKFVRVLGPGSDSGWLITGENPHESAKHHARKWCNGGEGFFFIAKYDRVEPEYRTADTPRPLHGHSEPQPIWHRQKPWQNDFPLPSELWSDVKREDPDTIRRSKEEVERDVLVGMLKKISKGPQGSSEMLADDLIRSSLTDRER